MRRPLCISIPGQPALTLTECVKVMHLDPIPFSLQQTNPFAHNNPPPPPYIFRIYPNEIQKVTHTRRHTAKTPDRYRVPKSSKPSSVPLSFPSLLQNFFTLAPRPRCSRTHTHTHTHTHTQAACSHFEKTGGLIPSLNEGKKASRQDDTGRETSAGPRVVWFPPKPLNNGGERPQDIKMNYALCFCMYGRVLEEALTRPAAAATDGADGQNEHGVGEEGERERERGRRIRFLKPGALINLRGKEDRGSEGTSLELTQNGNKGLKGSTVRSSRG